MPSWWYVRAQRDKFSYEVAFESHEIYEPPRPLAKGADDGQEQPLGELAAAAGTLVAVGLLLIMVVVEARPAEATFPGKNGKIAFVRDGPLDSHIFTINPDGSGLAKISTRPMFDSSPAWSPDGKKIVFSSANPDAPNLDVFVMKSDGTEVEKLLTKNDASDWEPNWQPLP